MGLDDFVRPYWDAMVAVFFGSFIDSITTNWSDILSNNIPLHLTHSSRIEFTQLCASGENLIIKLLLLYTQKFNHFFFIKECTLINFNGSLLVSIKNCNFQKKVKIIFTFPYIVYVYLVLKLYSAKRIAVKVKLN